jgi:hypothetical protein
MNEIDRLYQLPLAEFTPARNELAKQSKANRAAVGKLQKPNLPAWAVNQLYWHRRPVHDALIDAAERVRAAQAAVMSGRRADVATAESAHADALKAATQQIRGLLTEAGETASPATMTAVSETLQALPSGEAPGRLTRPLKPMGFEALTRLLAPGATRASAATVLPFPPKTAKAGTSRNAPAETPADGARRQQAEAKRQAEAARREEQARARDAKKLEVELREARSAERAAEAAAARAATAALTAEREHQELVRRVDEAADKAERLKKEAASKERAATEASVARQRVEARLKALS